MVKKDESSEIKFCRTPCQNPQDYFYEANKKCRPNCVSPYEVKITQNIKICFLPARMNEEEPQDIKTMVNANKIGAAGSKASASLSSSSPALAFLAGQISMLFSIRYIDVGYPEKVKLMFKMQGSSPFSLSFDFSIPESIQKELRDKTLPKIFEEYEVPSDFLENSWDTLMTLLLTLFSILVLSVVLKMIKRKSSVVGAILGGFLSFLK